MNVMTTAESKDNTHFLLRINRSSRIVRVGEYHHLHLLAILLRSLVSLLQCLIRNHIAEYNV